MQHVDTSTGWIQVILDSGILIAIVGAIFAAGRWVGTVTREIKDVRQAVIEIEKSTRDGMLALASRIDPLEREHWRRRGREEALEEVRHVNDKF